MSKRLKNDGVNFCDLGYTMPYYALLCPTMGTLWGLRTRTMGTLWVHYGYTMGYYGYTIPPRGSWRSASASAHYTPLYPYYTPSMPHQSLVLYPITHLYYALVIPLLWVHYTPYKALKQKLNTDFPVHIGIQSNTQRTYREIWQLLR